MGVLGRSFGGSRSASTWSPASGLTEAQWKNDVASLGAVGARGHNGQLWGALEPGDQGYNPQNAADYDAMLSYGADQGWVQPHKASWGNIGKSAITDVGPVALAALGGGLASGAFGAGISGGAGVGGGFGGAGAASAAGPTAAQFFGAGAAGTAAAGPTLAGMFGAGAAPAAAGGLSFLNSPAALIGGSSLLGAGASYLGAKKQADAADRASQVSADQYSQTRKDLDPWRQSGQTSLNQLQSRMGELTKPFSLEDFQESPAYRFNLEQGEAAINKGASARGNYYAPKTLQDLGRFTQGTASNEFQNAFSNYNTNMNNIWNRLYGLSESGRGAANQTGELGARASSQIGENIMGGGNARASGLVGGANAISGGVSDYYNNQLMQQVLNQRPNYGWKT